MASSDEIFRDYNIDPATSPNIERPSEQPIDQQITIEVQEKIKFYGVGKPTLHKYRAKVVNDGEG